jgi:hypothetical protein
VNAIPEIVQNIQAAQAVQDVLNDWNRLNEFVKILKERGK